MSQNLCPLCRRAMRLWALDARRVAEPKMRALCIRTAKSFRNECWCDDREKYDALVDLMAGTSTNKAAIWAEIENIKNRHGGFVPNLKQEAA